MGKKGWSWIPCCRCGTVQDPEGRVSVVWVLQESQGPLGTLQVTHHEGDCPACRRRNAWHLRTRSILGMTVRSATSCQCIGSATQAFSPAAAESAS